MQAFVISLAADHDRREFIRRQLDSLTIAYEFFDAVRGADRMEDPDWYDEAAARRLEGRGLRAGEVGCALSHQAVYAEIVRRGQQYALILEDDAILHPELPKVLSAIESGASSQGDVVFLERCDHARPGSARRITKTFSLAAPILVASGSCAQSAGYVVTLEAAKAMSGFNVPVRFPADNWGYYRGRVRFLGVRPSLTLIRQENSFGSTINAGGKRREFMPYSIKDLLWNDFKTYNPIGRALKNLAKSLLRGNAR
jgi:glycosyl transferase family 25